MADEQNKMVEINYNNYATEIQEEKTKVQEKLTALEVKLVDLELKERMINGIITRTNASLEHMDPTNFKWVGQTQTNLMKQIENLGLVKDIIIKYEDMILKYRNILIGIAEKKITNRVKIVNLQKEEAKAENNIGDLMVSIQDMLSGKPGAGMGGNPILDVEAQQNSQLFLSSIEEELEEGGY